MSVSDHFGLHGRAPKDREVEAGAKALREHQMKGRITREWEKLPNSDRKKWLEHSRIVLTAALR